MLTRSVDLPTPPSADSIVTVFSYIRPSINAGRDVADSEITFLSDDPVKAGLYGGVLDIIIEQSVR